MYRTLDLDGGISLGQNDTMTRQDAMYLFYNLLTAASQDYRSALPLLRPGTQPHRRRQGGHPGPLNETMDGPGRRERLAGKDPPSDFSRAPGEPGGEAITSADALVQNDVVYWSKSMNTLWVYTNRVTGTLQAVSPASAPASVTVAGKSYHRDPPPLTPSAIWAPFRVGDAVTLLLGRDNKVVSRASPRPDLRHRLRHGDLRRAQEL